MKKPVSDNFKDYLFRCIQQYNIQPYETRNTLVIWENRYKINGACYSIWGQTGNPHASGVDLLLGE